MKPLTILVAFFALILSVSANVAWNEFGDVRIRTGDGRVILEVEAGPCAGERFDVPFTGADDYEFCDGYYVVSVGPGEEFIDFNLSTIKWGTRLFAPQLQLLSGGHRLHDNRIIIDEGVSAQLTASVSFGTATIQTVTDDFTNILETHQFDNGVFELPIESAQVRAAIYILPASTIQPLPEESVLQHAVQVVDLGDFSHSRLSPTGIVCPLYKLSWNTTIEGLPAGEYYTVLRVTAENNVDEVEDAFRTLDPSFDEIEFIWDPQGSFPDPIEAVIDTASALPIVIRDPTTTRKSLINSSFWTTNSSITDADGDLIPDQWEIKYFANIEHADGSRDLDANGAHDIIGFLDGVGFDREGFVRVVVAPDSIGAIEYDRQYLDDRWFASEEPLRFRVLDKLNMLRYYYSSFDVNNQLPIYLKSVSSNLSEGQLLYEASESDYSSSFNPDGTHPWESEAFLGDATGNVEASEIISLEWALAGDDNDEIPWQWEYDNRLDPLNPDDTGKDVASEDLTYIQDRDNDGLSNYEEYLAGTNPRDNDSDNDGINDFDELNHPTFPTNPNQIDTDLDGASDKYELENGSDPCDWDQDGNGEIDFDDADGDGLTYDQEIAIGTSPYDADTDGDCFDDGYEHQYSNILDSVTGLPILDPNSSNNRAIDSDGDTLTNFEEYLLVKLNPGGEFYDITETDSDNDGTPDNQEDTDGDDMPDGWEISWFVYSQWYCNDILNYLSLSETYTGPSFLVTDGDEHSDGDSLTNLEEYNAGISSTNPIREDTDSDGIPDDWEVQYFGFGEDAGSPTSSDRNLDSDFDGVTDYQEYVLGFNPKSQLTTGDDLSPADNTRLDNLKDRDGDGIPDVFELRNAHVMNYNIFDSNQDSDRDFLTNIEEYQVNEEFNPNPSRYDSDFDGISDTLEFIHEGILRTYQISDSQDADFDNDGFLNYVELIAGTSLTSNSSKPIGEPFTYPDGFTGHPYAEPIRVYFDSPLSGISPSAGSKLLLRRNTSTQVITEISASVSVIAGGIGLEITPNSALRQNEEYQVLITPDTVGVSNIQPLVVRFFTYDEANTYRDTDGDGLRDDLEIFTHRTDPMLYDTDGDQMSDGWEVEFGTNPLLGTGNGGQDGDNDGDGVSNFEEYLNGSNPNNDDSDYDDTNDRNEIDQGSDPNNDDDNGQPPEEDLLENVKFVIGDPSGSHSENWTVEINGIGDDPDTRNLKAAGETFGEVGEVFHMLRNDKAYELHLIHTGTDPKKLEGDEDGNFYPDFDWTLEVHIEKENGGETNIKDDNTYLVIDPWDPETESIAETIELLVNQDELTYPWEGQDDREERYEEEIAQKRVLLLPVEVANFTNTGWKTLNELKVAKWEYAFDQNGNDYSLKDDFVAEDPDRFYVRIPGGASLASSGAVTVTLATEDNEDSAYDDPANEVEMEVSGNDLITKSMIMVSDDMDDLHSDNQAGADESLQDRTHKVSLGGNLVIKSIKINGSDQSVEMKVPVPAKKQLDLDFFRITTTNTYTEQEVKDAIKYVKERYAQVALKINDNYQALAWPQVMEDQKPHGYLGTGRFVALIQDKISDAHKVFIDNTESDGANLYFLPQAYSSAGLAVSRRQLLFETGEVNNKYLHKAYINKALSGNDHTAAHELLHILAPEEGVDDDGNPTNPHNQHTHNMLSINRSYDSTILDNRRINQEQEELIYGNENVFDYEE